MCMSQSTSVLLSVGIYNDMVCYRAYYVYILYVRRIALVDVNLYFPFTFLFIPIATFTVYTY